MLTCDSVTEQIQEAVVADDMTEVDRLLEVLDELDVPKPAVPLVSAALWYAEQGLRVFPLQARSKIPYPGTHGLHDASTDPAVIRAAWTHRPESNIGVATGHVVDVIDIDGAVGVKQWSQLIGTCSLPPVLGVVSTPRPGGSHLYIAATGIGNKAGKWPGVDYRGRGGYVVAPPSVNADGVRYRWDRPDRPLAGIS